MSKVQDVGATFEAFVGTGTAVVDFWAAWCGPCRALAPLLDDIADELTAVKFGKVDVDAFPQLAGQFEVVSIPNVCIFKDGKLVDRIIGVQPRDTMADRIAKHI